MSFKDTIKRFHQEYFGKPLILNEEESMDLLDPEKQESALGDPEGGDSEDEEVGDDTPKLVYLTNILLSALKFKPSDEFEAYMNMPKFIELGPYKKLSVIKNVLSERPEKIMQEAEGDEEVDVPDPEGDELPPPEGDEGGLPPEGEELPEPIEDEPIELNDAMAVDMLNLIIKAANVNPSLIKYGIGNLPAEANADNFSEVIEKIEAILI